MTEHDEQAMKDSRRRCIRLESGVERWKQWKCFQRKVTQLSSWVEAWDLGTQGPKTGSPGSSFYTNLRYFMRYHSIPLGADAAQVAIYSALVTRLGEPTCGDSRTPTKWGDAKL